MRHLLLGRAYLHGTRYYISPDWIFYYLSRLCAENNDVEVQELRFLVEARLKERIGCDSDVMGVLLRLLACQALGIRNHRDMETLLSLQCDDGGWDHAWVWCYGRTDIQVENRGVATAMATEVLRAVVNGSS